MKKLCLKSLTIVSDVEESANQFLFHNWNLILSDDNGAGKTTLIDMIFWTMGREVELKNSWQAADPKSLLEIEVDGETHFFAKYKENFFYRMENDEVFQEYTKITGAFSKKILEVFGLPKLQVFDRQKKLIYPTPDYVLSPFYIDQNSWNENIFSNIGKNFITKDSYDNILKLLIGHIDENYFEKQFEIQDKKDYVDSLKIEKDSIDISKKTIERICSLESSDYNYLSLLLDGSKKSIIDTIESQLNTLIDEKHKIIEDLNIDQNDKIFYKNQLKIIKSACVEIEQDYIEAVEYQDSIIKCPICGVDHQNSVELRTQILGDRTDAKDLYISLDTDIKIIEERIRENKKKLEVVDSKIDDANNLFSMEEDLDGSRISLEKLASLSIDNKLNEENYRLVENIRSENKELRKLRKTYKEDVDEENIAAIDIFFKARFSTLINVLKVTDSNYKEITSPLKYNNLSCGKGSEKSRAVLALYLSIWQTMEMNKSCFFPLFIDTPNQHEQDKVNYPTIINTISDNISTDTQIFICGLDNIALDKIKNISNITKLSNPILTKEKYAIFKDLF